MDAEIVADISDRLSAHSTPRGDCLLWTGALTAHGYGRMTVRGRKYAAHRASYEIRYGDIPPGMQVCHRCDVPKCVNPKHLFLGTAHDNHVDAVQKGRKRSVEITQFTSGELESIRSLYSQGQHSIRRLAEMFDLDKDTIHRLVKSR